MASRELVPCVKNTFVDLIDPAAEEHKCQLRKSQSWHCGELNDCAGFGCPSPLVLPCLLHTPENRTPLVPTDQTALAEKSPASSRRKIVNKPIADQSWPAALANTGSLRGNAIETVINSSIRKDALECSASEAAPCPLQQKTEERQPPQFATRPRSMHSFQLSFHHSFQLSRLRGSDKNFVSPPFQFSLDGRAVTFKMRISAKAKADADTKGSTSFEKSGGMGIVEVKCEASDEKSGGMGIVSYCIRVGKEDSRGPVDHNFAEHAWSGLPKTDELFDFNKSAEDDSFTVWFEGFEKPLPIAGLQGFEKPSPICESSTPMKPEHSRTASFPTVAAPPELPNSTPQKKRNSKYRQGYGQ